MPFDTPALLAALDSVTAIPVIPFAGDEIDYPGHAKNIDYLMQNNYLDDDRPRVIAIGGTSLLHHIPLTEQSRLVDQTGERMGEQGVLISGIVPNPLATAGELVATQSKLRRPPDAFLLMPLSGINNPDGIYDQYMRFADKYGGEYGARFIYYFRQPRDRDVLVKLLNESPHFVGVKIGTGVEDVQPLIEGVGESGLVIWGIGDRCTRPAELGTRGHTSGIAVAFARASDEINNAQRRGDYETSRALEAKIAPLEEIRFRNGRVYNYSAVVAAMHLSGFQDIEGGEGGPFNPRVPAGVADEIRAAIEGLKAYH